MKNAKAHSAIKTLSLNQLRRRAGWSICSKQNIFEYADAGCFGLYVKPSKKMAVLKEELITNEMWLG